MNLISLTMAALRNANPPFLNGKPQGYGCYGKRAAHLAGSRMCSLFFMSARPGIDKSYDLAWTSRATRHGQVVRLGMDKSCDSA